MRLDETQAGARIGTRLGPVEANLIGYVGRDTEAIFVPGPLIFLGIENGAPKFLAQIISENPQMRAAGNPQTVTFAGRQGLQVRLRNVSEATGSPEIVLLTTAMVALFCSVIMKKSSIAMMTSYLAIIVMFCAPLAIGFFANTFYRDHPATLAVRELSFTSPFSAARAWVYSSSTRRSPWGRIGKIEAFTAPRPAYSNRAGSRMRLSTPSEHRSCAPLLS